MKRGYLYIAVTTLLFSSMEVALKLISGQFNPIQLNFSIGRVMRWGAFAPGIRTAPIIKSVVGSSFSILWLDENNVFTFLGMNSLN